MRVHVEAGLLQVPLTHCTTSNTRDPRPDRHTLAKADVYAEAIAFREDYLPLFRPLKGKGQLVTTSFFHFVPQHGARTGLSVDF
mmetsp:Transcript_51120/g.105702  ORF Transcript_51120/g.105702 Transcript_51120/m.105702 type:complete len:84 (+) Transcript_51120:206-457(+)